MFHLCQKFLWQIWLLKQYTCVKYTLSRKNTETNNNTLKAIIILFNNNNTHNSNINTSSTIYCVALSQAQAPWRHVSHTRCAPVGESDLTEWHKFRWREVDVLRGKPHALIHSRSRTSRTAVHWLALQRRRQNWVSPSIRTSLLGSTLFPSSSRRPAYGVSRQWAWWRSSDDGWRESTRSHALRRSCVSPCRSLFSAETLPVF